MTPERKPGPYGRFYLQELINSGGMADIWVVTDQDGRTYALRLLRSQSFFDFTTRRRFTKGCEILSQIHNHDHVATFYENGKIDGSLYCQMEYVAGSNLKQLFARQDPILHDYLGNILIDMAVALEHVHDSGFMHLDFKPENVLITPNGNVKLVDFDLARPRPAKPEKAAKNPGTPAYMSPEQLQRQPFDHRVDIFAYGVTAYELLTGQKPFVGDTPDEILRKQLNRAEYFVAPRQLNPDIPFALEKSVVKCLENDPDKRYPIMSVLIHELESTLYL